MEQILLIRDNSELSGKVENYLKEQNTNYVLFYSNEMDCKDLPYLLVPNLNFILKGERGFNFYKKLKEK